MKTMRFVWIDDDKDRMDQASRAIEDGPQSGESRASLLPVFIDKDPLDTLQVFLVKAKKPDLLLIDHFFNKRQKGMLVTGSVMAQLARLAWPEVPMVCVSAKMERDTAFNQDSLAEYTAAFSYPKLISHHLEDLFAVARDFRKVPCGGTGLRDGLVRALGAPKADKRSLAHILPPEFGPKDLSTTKHRVASWIFNVFLARPGLLLEELNVATYLGLSQSGFRTVQALFEPARYRGPFFTEARPLWWLSEVQRVLGEVSTADARSSQEAGRALAGITSSAFSSCYVCRDPSAVPTLVARADSRSREPFPVCAKHAQPDPEDAGAAPGFETLWVIAPGRRA